MATITSYYAQTALKGAKRLGVNEADLLQKAGINPELISTTGARIHEDQLSLLIRLLWNTLEDEFMGFTAHKCKQGSFAMMCGLVSHCDNLESLFKCAIKFYRLLTDDIIMQLEQQHNDVIFSVNMNHPELDPDHFYLEFWLVIWHRFASWITGCQIQLKRANFHYKKPTHYSEFQFLFPCKHYFNQPKTSLVFGPQYLSKPLIKTQREIAHFLKNSPADLMTIPGNNDSTTLKIKSLIIKSTHDIVKFPSLDVISKQLHLSPQTLRRQLKSEGSSYQKIKNNVRRDIAIEKITVQNMSICDVATLLGFAEPRSFSRAFKQWTGLPPSHYRSCS